MAFRGYYDNTLDAKNRLTIPAKLRAQLADGVVVALQRDAPDCVAVWASADFAAFLDGLLVGISPLSESYGTIERFYNGWAREVELDAAGRVMVPAKLLEQAGLGRELAVIGVGNRLEVYNRDIWQERSRELAVAVKDIGPGTSSVHTS
jgi:MraZ protein